MPYTPYHADWEDYPSTDTPVTAEALEYVEAGITTAQSGLEAHIADSSDAHDASAISIVDSASDFTATDVEGALAELQSDNEAHLADTSDAHDASAISIVDAGGYFTGTEVEAALQELGASTETSVYARAYRSGTQAITASNHTKIQFNAESFDSDSYFDIATNYRFTPLVAGVYWVSIRLQFDEGMSANLAELNVYKNGGSVARGRIHAGANNQDMYPSVSTLVQMNGSTDYVEGYFWHNSSAGTLNIVSGAEVSYIDIFRVGPL